MTPIGFPLEGDSPSKNLTSIERTKSKKLNISSQKFPCFMPKLTHMVRNLCVPAVRKKKKVRARTDMKVDIFCLIHISYQSWRRKKNKAFVEVFILASGA